jgi:ubiquitin-conjugating enzyme E2 O
MAQTECAIFEEDEVCKRINDRIIYGIVTESSEFLSSDEEEDDEDVLSRGTVRILWHPNGSETVEEEKKVNLYCLILKILLNFFNIFYQICVSEHFV